VDGSDHCVELLLDSVGIRESSRIRIVSPKPRAGVGETSPYIAIIVNHSLLLTIPLRRCTLALRIILVVEKAVYLMKLTAVWAAKVENFRTI